MEINLKREDIIVLRTSLEFRLEMTKEEVKEEFELCCKEGSLSINSNRFKLVERNIIRMATLLGYLDGILGSKDSGEI